ncbi:hypothetical protein NDU88_002555 [Pleurodeles waltl]|uniref:Uncharacterized protein n=1 Tax=Pleurodeles waltl TaxID=8319 RepID=A0AAV7T2R6_PLEWA|nr:hypothetical protein NDU88_002555 [Pleurodeles waltl]
MGNKCGPLLRFGYNQFPSILERELGLAVRTAVRLVPLRNPRPCPAGRRLFPVELLGPLGPKYPLRASLVAVPQERDSKSWHLHSGGAGPWPSRRRAPRPWAAGPTSPPR